MANVVKQVTEAKAGMLNVKDALFIGAAKLSTEMAMSRLKFVGNGTFRSGAIKAGVAVALSMAIKKTSLAKPLSYVTTGMLLDGMEDVVLAAKQRWGGKMNASSESESAGYAFA